MPQQPVKIDAERHQCQAQRVDTQDFRCLADLEQAVRVLVQLPLVREKDKDQNVFERERQHREIGVLEVVAVELHISEHADQSAELDRDAIKEHRN